MQAATQSTSPADPRASELLFLKIVHPSESLAKDAQRLIRSHVTREQHRKRREIRAQENARLDSYNTDNNRLTAGHPALVVRPNQDIPATSLYQPACCAGNTTSNGPVLAFLNSDHPSQVKASNARRLVRSHVTKWQHRRRRAKGLEKAEKESTTSESSCTTPATPTKAQQLPSLVTNSSEKLISKGAAAFRNVILQDASNTLGICIKRLGFELRGIMDHYIMIADTHAPDFEAHYKVKGIVRRRFLPFLLTDPALVCAIILVTIYHRMWSMGLRQPSEDLLRLKGFVIAMFNHALADPYRSCSDQLIIAVANMAIIEALFGSEEIYHVHMKGLMRMLRIRGGLQNLGYDGYLARVLIWYDVNCSAVIGCAPYMSKVRDDHFEEALPPNKENFSVGIMK